MIFFCLSCDTTRIINSDFWWQKLATGGKVFIKFYFSTSKLIRCSPFCHLPPLGNYSLMNIMLIIQWLITIIIKHESTRCIIYHGLLKFQQKKEVRRRISYSVDMQRVIVLHFSRWNKRIFYMFVAVIKNAIENATESLFNIFHFSLPIVST